MSDTRNTAGDGTATPETGATVQQATDTIAALLAREDGEPDEQQDEEEGAQQPDEAEGETQAEEPEEGDDADAEAEEGEQDEGEEPEEPDPATTLVTIEVDGKAEKLSLEEVKKGYLRTADYTRKTQALAEERRAFHGEAAAVREERAQYAALLPALAKQLQDAAPQEPDWDRLAVEDPVEFNRQWAAKQMRDSRMQAIQAEQKRVADEAAREAAKQRADALAAAREELPRLMPAWKDPNRFKADAAAVRDYLSEVGYSPQQIAALDDPRAVVIAHKARLYDEMTRKGMQPVARKQQQPQQARPLPAPAKRPGAAARPPISDTTRAKMRLAQTHSARDAAKVIEGLL